MKRKTELAYAQGCAATRGHLSKLKRTDSFNFKNRAQNILVRSLNYNYRQNVATYLDPEVD